MGGGVATTKVLFIVTTLLGLILRATAAADDLVHQWCQKTGHNNLCVSIIKADPRTDLKKTPNGLCAILRDRVVADATATSKKIPDFVKRTTNLEGIECLEDCSFEYKEIITILKSVNFTFMNQTNYMPMAMDVANGYKNPQDCEDCFTRRPGTSPSPLTSDNQNIKSISLIIASIIDLVVCNKQETCVD